MLFDLKRWFIIFIVNLFSVVWYDIELLILQLCLHVYGMHCSTSLLSHPAFRDYKNTSILISYKLWTQCSPKHFFCWVVHLPSFLDHPLYAVHLLDVMVIRLIWMLCIWLLLYSTQLMNNSWENTDCLYYTKLKNIFKKN